DVLHSEDTTDQHGDNESQGRHPRGPPADLVTQRADAYHGEKVIEPEDGVSEPAHEAAAVTTRMSESQAG
ncbi:MAG: hypothetical protein VB980_01055, partial [Opitutales bacterium]